VEAVVLEDFRTLARGILEHTFEIAQSGIRDFPAVKEEFFLRSDEVARGELTQRLVVDVTPHGPAGAPSENRGGGIGGAGLLDWLTLFVLLPLVAIGAGKFGSGRR